MESIPGQMDLSTAESGLKIRDVVKVSTHGVMAGFMKVIGMVTA